MTPLGRVALLLALAAPTLAAPTQAPAATWCTPAQLHLQLKPLDGAAGTFGNRIIITNTSHAACNLQGYPTLHGKFHGRTTIQSTASENDDPGPLVRLAPGQKASVYFRHSITEPPEQCPRYQQLMVVLPHQSAELLVNPDVSIPENGTTVPLWPCQLVINALVPGDQASQ